MAGTVLTGLYNYIDDYVDKASDEPTITLRAIRAVMRDFCRFTHLWKETLDRINVVADTGSYALTAPTGNGDVVEVAGLDDVQYKEDGADDDQFFNLTIRSREWFDEYDKRWEHRTAVNPRACFYDHLDGKIYLVDTPDTASALGLLVRCWLMPGLTATTAPGFLFDKYSEHLAIGVAGYMCRMTNQRWSNPELGDHFWNIYQSHRMNAQQDQDRGFADVDSYRVIPEEAFTGGSRGRSWPTGTGTV